MAEIFFHNAPTKCQVCSKPLVDEMFDARMTTGVWACMDADCFDKYGVGLGQGFGQKYVKQADGRWLKVV